MVYDVESDWGFLNNDSGSSSASSPESSSDSSGSYSGSSSTNDVESDWGFLNPSSGSSNEGHPGGTSEESFAAPPNTISVVNTTSWPGGYNQFNTDGTNIVVSDNIKNTTIQSGTGDSKFQVNNTESVEVLTAVEELKRLNPGWSDRDALNYLEGGSWAMRKFTRGDLSVDSRSQAIKDKKKQWSTFGLGLRGKFETNVGVPTTRDNYGKMLDVMSGNWAPNSEMDNLKKALLAASKNLKNPSKFAEYMKGLPSLGTIKGFQQMNIAHPEAYAKNPTEKGSPGWMALAHRQAKRGELMPDNTDPLDSLREFGSDADKDAAYKYQENLIKQGVSKINKPMTWGKGLERGESEEERIKRYKELGYNINPETGELEDVEHADLEFLDLEDAFITDPVNEADGLADALAGSGAGADGVTSFFVNGNIIDINKPFSINKADSINYLSGDIEDSVYNPSTSTGSSVDVSSDSSSTTISSNTANPVWTGPRDRKAFEWIFFGQTSQYE